MTIKISLMFCIFILSVSCASVSPKIKPVPIDYESAKADAQISQEVVKQDDSIKRLHELFTWIEGQNDPQLVSKLEDFFKVYYEVQLHYVDAKSSKELMDLAMKGMVSGLDHGSHLFLDKEAQEVLGFFSEGNIPSIVYKDLNENIAYIKINGFIEDTSEKFRAALEKSSSKEKLIIDLRDNGGGSVSVVEDMLGDFLGSGRVVARVTGRDEFGNNQEILETTPIKIRPQIQYTKKAVCLVNNSSASASEIMAGNMKYHKLCEVVGVQTYGKATMQNYLDLDSPNHALSKTTRLMLGITSGRYSLPRGILPDGTFEWLDISSVGLTPDIEVKQPDNFKDWEYLTERDSQFQEAIKFLNK